MTSLLKRIIRGSSVVGELYKGNCVTRVILYHLLTWRRTYLKEMAVIVICLLLWGTALATEPECPASGSSPFQLRIQGYRNETGHWIAQVSLEHPTGDDPWEVDVKKTVRKCSQTESVLLVISIAEPPQGNNATPSQHSRFQSLLSSGYKFKHGFGLYKFYSVAKSWTNAKEICEEDGAHLIIFNSREEFESVKGEFLFSDFIHSGFHDFKQEGTFVTVLGNPLNSTGYAQWAQNKPEKNANKRCGYLNKDGEMGNQVCSDREEFICEASS